MTRVGLLHTVPALAEGFERDVRAAVPGVEVVHVVDSTLLADAVRSGVDDGLSGRVAMRIEALAATGVDAVLVTCSSIGEAAERAALRVGVPVLRVDAPMADQAVSIATEDGATGRIAVLATLAATLGPTGRLVERAAAGRPVSVTATVVDGAIAARDAGDPARFAELVGDAVLTAAEDADVVVLAQASMAAAVPADVRVPVLTSPTSGVAALVAALGADRDGATPATGTTGATDRPTGVVVHRDGDRLVVRAETYSITVRHTGAAFTTAPYAVLRGPDGRRFADLDLLASAHTTDGPDETTSVEPPVVERDGADVVISVRCASTVWLRRTTVLRVRPDRAELTVEVEGDGVLDDVTLLGGRATLTSGAAGVFRSAIRFRGVLVPAATEPVRLVRPAATPAVLGVVGDAAPGRLSAVFSPPPLVLGLTRTVPTDATAAPTDGCLGLGLRAPVSDLTFTAMHYEPLDGGFLLRLAYEGHTAVRDGWTSPVLVLRPAVDGWGVLEDHRADLVATGCAPDTGPVVHDWWTEPLFCGWGAQSARSVHELHDELATPGADTAPEGDEDETDVARLAPTFARADVYDAFLARLGEHGLRPGTVVVDDRWQREYGTGSVDTDSWPDLRGWIRRRHDDGQRVLLWWKAWDPQGVPPEECVRDATGRAVTVDPTNPAYRARLTGIVRDLLGPDGLGADGVKIDFTQRGPSGRTLVGGDGGERRSWGIALLHDLLRIVSDAARSVRPDALLVAHAVHPGFADVCGMVRTNDVSKADPEGRPVPVADQLTMRHGIVTRTLPHHPVDTDQWPMPNRAEWLAYAERQVDLGVPALYYVESIDRSGEAIGGDDLRAVAATWDRYRARGTAARGSAARGTSDDLGTP